jgi:hypothetical protein
MSLASIIKKDGLRKKLFLANQILVIMLGMTFFLEGNNMILLRSFINQIVIVLTTW